MPLLGGLLLGYNVDRNDAVHAEILLPSSLPSF